VPSLAVVVILALATYRLARFLPSDSLFLPVRERMYAWAWDDTRPTPEARAPWRTYVYELATCQHCEGVWFAVIVYCAWRWGGDVALAILTVFALAGLQSAVASFTIKADE
jgi:hypothetical protein